MAIALIVLLAGGKENSTDIMLRRRFRGFNRDCPRSKVAVHAGRGAANRCGAGVVACSGRRLRTMGTERKGRRKRARRDPGSQAGKPVQRAVNYRRLRHPFTHQSIFTEEEVEAIHATALRVLEELGLRILLPEARRIFVRSGAVAGTGDMVAIGRDIVEEALGTAPSSIRLRAINPERELAYENGAMLFMAGAGCPNATDMERGRRPGDLAAYEETIKLQQHFDVIHLFGPSVEPQDIPGPLRHYEMIRAQMEYGDKPVSVSARGRAQVEECLEMIQLGFDLTADAFTDGVWAWTNINSNSPRTLDNAMAQGIIDFARARQMSVITPFCLAGAMAPVTVAGALTLQHAEALAGIALAQLSSPGAPVSYGGFSSNVDMKSGAPAFGTPEHVKMQIGTGQLARHVGLPWRSASGAASNTADMQAALENSMALWGAILAQATLTVHAAGWLEGGLSFGYEKYINDIEALQSMAELCARTDASEAEIGWEALAEVKPGGHFFSTRHTMERYRTAFYAPLVADIRNFGNWEAAGAKTSAERATDIWKSILRNFEPPPTGAEAAERIAGYIEAGRKAGGAALPE